MRNTVKKIITSVLSTALILTSVTALIIVPKTYTHAASYSPVGQVTNLKAKSYLSRGMLTWSPASGATGYNVYVKRANGEWLKKLTTPYTSYLSGKLKLNKTYKFAVKPYRVSNGVKTYAKATKANITANPSAYGKTPSGTWVEVCTETQHMYMYVNNKLYVSTPVITGYAYNDRRTTPGYHKVLNKKTNAVLRGSYGGQSWNVTVAYWMAFTNDGQGIHDAEWQHNDFGKEIYKQSGRASHGCVNTPTSSVAKMFSKAYVGMPVIVF